jgi:glycosyltransferase involved in cell wall biosynthesis
MPPKLNLNKVAFSVTNCICYDQRVLKIAETVSELGCDIIIIGRRRGYCCEADKVKFRTKRFKMLFKSGFLFYKFFNIRLLFHLLIHKYDLLVSNDLDTLLPNFLVSKLKGVPLVYDSHEYFTGLPEIQHRPFVKMVWQIIERSIFPHLKHVMTVSDPIADLYEKMYKIRPAVVRNFSKSSALVTPFTRADLNINPDDLLVIIQGTGINIDKGAEELIEAVNITSGVSLLVVGSGDVLPQLKGQVRNLNLENKIKFIPSVSWDILMKYTKSADVGVCLEKDTNLNYRFSLANKLFDYISAGKPVIASDLPEVNKFIEAYRFGVIIPKVTPVAISDEFQMLKNNHERLSELKRNAVLASESINWEKESLKIKEFYQLVLDSVHNK